MLIGVVMKIQGDQLQVIAFFFFFFFKGQGLISWKAKKQAIVSRSSAESEYRALAMMVAELQWYYTSYKICNSLFQHQCPSFVIIMQSSMLYVINKIYRAKMSFCTREISS